MLACHKRRYGRVNDVRLMLCCSVLQQSFENQPPGPGSYQATVSPAGEASGSLDSMARQDNVSAPEDCRVHVDITKLGQAAVVPMAGAEWPAWASKVVALRLTFGVAHEIGCRDR